MIALILTALIVFAVLCISEIGWRKKLLNNEVGRKFVHVIVGSFVAFWPFFLSWNQIRLFSLAFLVVVVISSRLKIFRSIHSVQRPTYGEVFFALTVGALTFITHSKGIYAVAILQMSLADGLAAIFGTRYGKGNGYKIFGHAKSVAGTSVFFAASLALLAGYAYFSVAGIAVHTALLAALVATGLENLAVYGLDNLAVPLFVGIVLTRL